MRNIALSSSSMVVPGLRSGSLDFRIRSGVSRPSQILSSASCRDAGSDISLSRLLSSHKCSTVFSIVQKLSSMIALWSTLTLTAASKLWCGRFCSASSTSLPCMLLEDFHSQSGLSDPWLWDSPTFVPSRCWSSNCGTSLDSFPMSWMLMPSDSVLVGKTLFGVDYET